MTNALHTVQKEKCKSVTPSTTRPVQTAPCSTPRVNCILTQCLVHWYSKSGGTLFSTDWIAPIMAWKDIAPIQVFDGPASKGQRLTAISIPSRGDHCVEECTHCAHRPVEATNTQTDSGSLWLPDALAELLDEAAGLSPSAPWVQR